MFRNFIKKDIRYCSSITNDKIRTNLNNISLPKLNLLERGLKNLFGFIFSPFGLVTVKQNHILTLYIFGKYSGYRTTGLSWINPISFVHTTYCGDITHTYNNMHLTDSLSNPIRVKSYVIYKIINPVNNVINLENPDVLTNWMENNTRQVISNYSYAQLTDSIYKKIIMDDIVNKINSELNAELYGIEIQQAGLLEINYAPEIAESMLVKQKAKITIEARKDLVDATIHLIKDIGEKLDDKLTGEEKAKLITCLTVSIIGDKSPPQVINLN